MVEELLDRLDDAQDQLIDLGIGIAQLLLILALTVLVSRWLRRRLRRRFRTASSPVLTVVAENSAAVGVYIVALTLVLALWGMTWAGLVTALSIGTVAVAFGLQDFLRSVVGGLLVLVEQPFALGDRIKIKEAEGTVERIDLRATVIRTDAGDRVTIPNALLFTEPVINRSPNRTNRVLTISGLNGSPSELKQRALDALSGLPGLAGPPVITVRTRKGRQRVRRALDALPGVDLDDRTGRGRATGTGLRIVLSGDRDPAMLEEAKRRLQSTFPNARIGS